MSRGTRVVLTCSLGLGLACAGEIDDIDAVREALDGGNGGNGGNGAVACPSIGIVDARTELIDPTCAVAGCHGEGSMQGGLSLEGDLTVLVDQPANTVSCDGLLLVDASTVADSLMVTILDDDPPCSSPMPFPTGGLTADERACIETWARALVAASEE